MIDFLKTKQAGKTPIWLMRQAGRYLPEYRKLRSDEPDFIKFCLNPDLCCEATLQPLRRYDFDAGIIFSDILVIPYALNQSVTFKEGIGPVLGGRYNLSNALNEDMLQPVYTAIEKTRAAMPADKALLGFAGLPWTLATYMIEQGTSKAHHKILTVARAGDVDFINLMALLEQSVITHCLNQIQAGANAIQLFESWASLLCFDVAEKYSLDPIKRISAAIKEKYPHIPIFVFGKGYGRNWETIAKIDTIDVISIDYTIDPSWAVSIAGGKIVQGNLDPLALVVGGDQLTQQTQMIMDKMAGHPHIFNLGHGILPQTPPENVTKFIEIVKK